MAYVETDPSRSPGQSGESSMPTEWYYARDGEQFGPLGFDELKQWASTGLLRADDLVWGEGEPDWKPAARIAGLFPRLETEWYYSQGSERSGPVADEVLKQLADTGQLHPSDLVWSEREPDWMPAFRIPGLFSDFAIVESASQPEGMIRRDEEYTASDESRAMLDWARQAVMVGYPIRLLALLLQAPLASVAICAAFGADLPAKSEASSGLASVLFWMDLAALWFGLSDALIGDVIGAARSPGRPRAVAPMLQRLGAMGALAVIQCAVAWMIVSNRMGLSGAGLASLALLILTSAVGLALGRLVVAMAPRPPSAWAASGLVVVLLWLFGGGPQSFPRESPWAGTISNAVPSRWAFEGLLLLRAGRTTSPEAARLTDEHGRWDIAGAYFPVDSERMGARADVMALVSMLIGLSAASAFLTWASEQGRAASPDP
jgi:GYF domain 2/ABC-2 type transporter